MFDFDLQLFGGGGGGTSTTVQKVEVAPQSAEERRLQEALQAYQNRGLAGAEDLQQQALNYMRSGRIVDPDYNALLDQYNAENDLSNKEYKDAQDNASAYLQGILEKARSDYQTSTGKILDKQAAQNEKALADYKNALSAAQSGYAPESSRITDEYNASNDASLKKYTDAVEAAAADYENNFRNQSKSHDEASRKALDDYKNTSNANLSKRDAATEQYLADYEQGMTEAQQKYNDLMNRGEAVYNETENPAYQKYLAGMDKVNAGFDDVLAGKLPEEYQKARVQALSDDMNQTMGNYINNMAKRGIINSTVSSSGLDSINQSISDTLAKNYASDIAQHAGLLKDKSGLLQNEYDTSHKKAAYERDSLNDYATTGLKTATDYHNTFFNNRSNAANDSFKAGQDIGTNVFNAENKIADDQYNRALTDYKDFYNTKTGAAKAILDASESTAKNRYATNMDNIGKIYEHATSNAGNIYNASYASNNNTAKGLMDAANNIYNGTQADAQNIYNAKIGTATNKYNADQTHMNNALSGAIQAQVGSYYAPGQLLNMADQLYSPSQQMFNQLYAGRHGASTTTTTTSRSGGADNSGLYQAVGSVGSALIACFIAGTQITTPDGYKNIEDIKVGDKVISVNKKGEQVIAKVKSVNEPYKVPTIVVQWDNSTRWRTTINQRFFDGTHFANLSADKEAVVFNGLPTKIININEGPEALVYDFAVDNDLNVFFANDVAAEGYGD